jgi:hypothetical protein
VALEQRVEHAVGILERQLVIEQILDGALVGMFPAVGPRRARPVRGIARRERGSQASSTTRAKASGPSRATRNCVLCTPRRGAPGRRRLRHEEDPLSPRRRSTGSTVA